MDIQNIVPSILAIPITLTLLTSQALAVNIDNDLLVTDVGRWRVDVLTGGESQNAWLTAVGNPSTTQFNETEVIFDYFSYVDVGTLGGAFRLPSTALVGPTLVSSGAGPDEVTSSGSFPGAAGNTILWDVSSTIADGVPTMVNTYTFTAVSGTLGNIRFWQYLDEDVLDFFDDVFFTHGSIAGADLELFTVDNTEAIGVSHSGALTAGQGNNNAAIVGYAACEWDSMRPAIANGTQPVSPVGSLCAALTAVAAVHPVVGPSFGPIDVVSSLAWDIDPTAATATIITTLGGVPEAPIPALTCWGDMFLEPFDVTLSLKKKTKRTIPVKMVLHDASGNPITDQDVSAPPVINVMYSASGAGDDFVDGTASLLPNGAANDDNIFRWDPDGEQWIYNLGTSIYMAPGLYKVTAVAGDGSYAIDALSCHGEVIRLP